MNNAPTNRDDVIDSRDIDARIEELTGERETLTDELEDWQAENGEELRALESFRDDAQGYCPDWRYGVALIRESYFENYARELAEDLHGSDVRNAHWPFDCVDWERAADELKHDYSGAEFSGVTYYFR